jgi:hypothetical protein
MDTLTENAVISPMNSHQRDETVRVSPAVATQQLGEEFLSLWSTIRYFFVLFAITLLFDAASTILVMVRFGPGIELHPVVRMISQLTGPVAGPLLGAVLKAVGAVIIALYWRRFAACILSLASALYFAATCYNIWGMYGRVIAP